MKQLRKLSKIILLAGITIWLTSCGGGEGGTAPYVDEGDTAPPADEDQSGIPHLSSIRRGHTATLQNDGTVLITGGSNSRGSHLDSAEVYDPVSDSFTALTKYHNQHPSPKPRSDLAE
jgi:hypothetical protein